MAHRRTSPQAGGRSGELSGVGRVGWTVEEFGASCGELARPKETARYQQGKCNSCPVLHRAEPVEGCRAPRHSPPQSVMLCPDHRLNWPIMMPARRNSSRWKDLRARAQIGPVKPKITG